jgi:large repetitive protein
VTWARLGRWIVPVLLLGWSVTFAFAAEARVGDGLVGPRRSVSVIDTSTEGAAAKPIKVGPYASGRRLFVANSREDTVSVISAATGRRAAVAIAVAHRPTSIAISPVADRAYVTGLGPGTLLVLDTKTNKMIGKPVEVGAAPLAVAFAPDGRRACIVHN